MDCLDLSLELLEDSEGSLLGGGLLLSFDLSLLDLSFDLLEDSEDSLLGDSFLD